MNLENNPHTSEKTENTASSHALPPLVLPEQLREETLAQLVLEVLVRKALAVDDTWSKWVLVSGIHVLKGNKALMPCAHCLSLKSSCSTCASSSTSSTFPGASVPVPERKNRYIEKQENKYQDEYTMLYDVLGVEDGVTFVDFFKRNITDNQASNCENFDVKTDTVRNEKDCERQQKEREVEVEMKDDRNRISSHIPTGNFNVPLQMDSERDIDHRDKFVDARAKLRKIIINSDKMVTKSVKADEYNVKTNLHNKGRSLNSASHGAPGFPVTTAKSDTHYMQLSSAEPSGQLFFGTKKSVGVQCSPTLIGIVSNQSIQVNTLKSKTQRMLDNNISVQKKSNHTQTESEGVEGIFRIKTKLLVDMDTQGILDYHDHSTIYNWVAKSWELIPICSHKTDSRKSQNRSRRKLADVRKNLLPHLSCDKKEPMFHGRPLVGRHDAHHVVNIPLNVECHVMSPLDPRLVGIIDIIH